MSQETTTPTFDQLNIQQQAVATTIEGGENVMVTGPAGTGKSFLLRYLREKFPKMPVTASTGIAALGVGGCTLHSWAGLGLGQEPAEVIAKKHNERQNGVWYAMKTAERLAIDEISMVDADLFDKLDKVLRIVRQSPRPFGGLQLILFGDFLQLPPVEKEGNAVRFAFQSKVWAEARIHVYVLSQVMRQKDQQFASILSRIRVGDTSEDVRAVLRPRINAADPNPEISPVSLATHNSIADRINAENLAKIKEEEVRFEAQDWSDGKFNGETLDKNCIAPKTLILKVGAQVMLLWNLDVGAGLVNGSLGVVIEIRKDKFRGTTPVVKFSNGMILELERQQWSLSRNGDVLASRQQFPLRLSWGISIHKSQGMTLEKVRVHIKQCFADGQAYVAMSRAKSLEGLFIADINGNSIRANSTALEFYKQHAA